MMGGGHHASDELDSSDDEDQQQYSNNQPGPSQVFMNNNGNNKNTKAAKFDQLLKVSFLQEAYGQRASYKGKNVIVDIFLSFMVISIIWILTAAI